MTFSRLATVVLAATIGLVPIVPPEHAHEREEHGHPQIIVHRHAEPHGVAPSADHDATFDHDDDDAPILTVDVVYTVPATHTVIAGAAPRVVALVEPPVLEDLHQPTPYVELLIHGPPRAPSSPRAPPFLPLL